MLNPVDRHARLGALHRRWNAGGAGLPDAALHGLLADAAAWDGWPLVDAVGTCLADREELDTAETLHLIDARRALGRGEAALALARALRHTYPFAPDHAGLEAELRSWLGWRQRFPLPGSHDELTLEPLAHHHARGFAWQYHDPAIAQLCCLPKFIDGLEWHHWLAGMLGERRRLLYAVLHRDWGLIGCVSLVLHRDAGFFYYWLGPDFQGRGFGPRAGACLLAMAERTCGLRSCYAKAFDVNLRSRRGLDKMGFADLGMRGTGEDCNQVFYRRGPPQTRRRTADQLHWLLESMDASVRAAAPASSRDDAPEPAR